jgi:flagellum-specific peptidoglycan hydrolase FlgJ
MKNLIIIGSLLYLTSCTTDVVKTSPIKSDDHLKIFENNNGDLEIEEREKEEKKYHASLVSIKEKPAKKKEVKIKKPDHAKYILNKKKWNSGEVQQIKYIERFEQTALEEQALYRIPASIKLAQGIIESGSGKGKLTLCCNIHFCIKDPYNGPNSVQHHDDDPNDHFVTYSSAWRSYRGHSKLLSTAGRYKFLFKLEITDYEGWAYGLKKAGYATNPKYAQELIKIIKKYQLYKLDK